MTLARLFERLELDPTNRELTVRLPDGTVLSRSRAPAPTVTARR